MIMRFVCSLIALLLLCIIGGAFGIAWLLLVHPEWSPFLAAGDGVILFLVVLSVWATGRKRRVPPRRWV